MAKFVVDNGLTAENSLLLIETDIGVQQLKVKVGKDRKVSEVEVNMG